MKREDVPSVAILPQPPHPRLIPFARPYLGADTHQVVQSAIEADTLTGGGRYTNLCHDLIRSVTGRGTPFLTPSCTGALEMAALLLDLRPGDEVVMPSWTFPSTANAFALRGAVPVFVDVLPDTLNIDPALVANAITPRTRAIVCVHYAGAACDLSALLALRSDRIALVEDAAQAYGSTWRGRALGSIGDLGTFSFHGTKNISCGEGGALVVARPDLVEAAEIAWEKGTNRLSYLRGEVEHYEWCNLGSSFLMSEITAAFLSTQLRSAVAITTARRQAWMRYARLCAEAEPGDLLTLPGQPADFHNGHMYFVRCGSARARTATLRALVENGIDARRHYRPLHLSPAGRRLGRTCGDMRVTEAAAAGLLRLPLDAIITARDQERIVGILMDAVRAADQVSQVG